MSLKLPFTLLHVFTSPRADTSSPGGTPLAVVHIPPSLALTHPQKSQIARSLAFSNETALLHESTHPIRAVEIYTAAGTPLPFAGAPTVGVANLLHHHSPSSGGGTITLLTRAGLVETYSISSTGGAGVVLPIEVPQQLKLRSAKSVEHIMVRLRKLQPGVEFVGEAHTEVVKGMVFIIVRVASVEGLAALRPYARLAELSKASHPGFAGTLFYVPQKMECVERLLVRARMFFGDGLEQPASAAAACALAAQLKIRDGVPGIDVVQGVEMGAESALSVDVGTVAPVGYKEWAGVKVKLEGRAVVVREGTVDVSQE